MEKLETRVRALEAVVVALASRQPRERLTGALELLADIPESVSADERAARIQAASILRDALERSDTSPVRDPS